MPIGDVCKARHKNVCHFIVSDICRLASTVLSRWPGLLFNVLRILKHSGTSLIILYYPSLDYLNRKQFEMYEKANKQDVYLKFYMPLF